MKKRILALILCLVLILPSCSRQDRDEKRACITMSSADNEFARALSESLTSGLEGLGYSVDLMYCDNDINTQLIQIENYAATDPDIIIIDCVGNDENYSRVLSRISEKRAAIVTINSSREIEGSDIQLLNSGLSKGICVSWLVTSFLNKIGILEDEKVDVLLLGTASNQKEIVTLAGYQLVAERFIRKFDKVTLSFIKEESDTTVYYIDGYGNLQVVKEPAGGLLLDENGYAIENPYYDPRVNLIVSSNFLNIQSNLEGQKAIDIYLADVKNRDICVVIGASGEAAVGAASRIEFYSKQGILSRDMSEIAVFGADDTEQNRTLVLQSELGNGVYRGFVGDFNVQKEVDNLLRTLKAGRTSSYKSYGFYSDISYLETIGLATIIDTGVSSMDIFG